MRKIIFLLLTLLSIPVKNQAQSCDFRDFTIVDEIIFANNVPILNPNDGLFLAPTNLIPANQTVASPRMDIFIPKNLTGEDINKKFPLVILCHSAESSKFSPTIRFIASEFAKRGYVVAAMDYRFDNRYKSGMVKLATQSDLIKSIDPVNGKSYNTTYYNRNFYSNAMDASLAIDFLINNSNLYKIDTSKIVLGGISFGAITTFYKLYVDNAEIASFFPPVFNTDNRYIDSKLNKSKIKSAFAYMGGIMDLNFINNNENTPIFIYHGTHEFLIPFYHGPMTCDPNLADLYGGGAIVEKLDNFNDAYGFSYYFIEASGIGHTLILGDSLASRIDTGYINLHLPDLFRFTYNSLNNPSYQNQVYKKITPHNACFDFCNNNFFNPYVNNGIRYDDIVAAPNKICSSIPNLSLTTNPWKDIIPQSCNTLYPPILNNCTSSLICTKENMDSIITANKFNYSKSFKIFPNPANSFMSLISQPSADIDKVEVLSINGKLYPINIEDISKIEKRIDISLIPNGIYVIRIYSKDDIFTDKIMIQR